MIQIEHINGLVRRYSDKGFKIRQIETGIVYCEAVDWDETTYSYEETDELIETETNEKQEPQPSNEVFFDTQNKDELQTLRNRIVELEEENAMLLFENLTGEVFDE